MSTPLRASAISGSDPTPWECGDCGRKFSTPQGLGGHRGSHRDKLTERNEEEEIESKEVDANEAGQESEAVDKFPCKDCGKFFSTPQALGGHRGGGGNLARCRSAVVFTQQQNTSVSPSTASAVEVSSTVATSTSHGATISLTATSAPGAPTVVPAAGKRAREVEENNALGRTTRDHTTIPSAATTGAVPIGHPSQHLDVRPLPTSSFWGPLMFTNYLGSFDPQAVSDWHAHVRSESLRSRTSRV